MKYDPRLLMNYYARLAPRERLLLGVAAVSVLLISLYSFVWDPLQTSRTQLTNRIAKKERELEAIQKKRDEYLEKVRRLEASQSSIPELDPKFPGLFAYLQTTVAQAVPHERIVSMNPSSKNIGTDFQEELVEIRLSQVSLPQLVDMMYRVELGEPPLRFSRLAVKKRANDIRNFDVTATVSLLKAVHQ
jgi:hypothetical protein